jgi:hypothetical protein
MKNNRLISMSLPFVVLLFVIIGCNFSSANMSSLTTSTDKEGKNSASSFKAGDTLYATATISNNPGKVKVTTYLVAEDAEGMSKGDTVKGSEVTVELDGSGVSNYSLPINEALPPGKYKLQADMINDAGEKKDSKTAEIKIEGSSQSKEKSTDEPKPDDESADDDDSN